MGRGRTSALPPPLRGRAGEGGRRQPRRSLENSRRYCGEIGSIGASARGDGDGDRGQAPFILPPSLTLPRKGGGNCRLRPSHRRGAPIDRQGYRACPRQLRRARDRLRPRRARREIRPARARPARRRADGRIACRPAATSTPSMCAPCRRRPPGSSAAARPICSAERYFQDEGEWPQGDGADRLGHVEHAHRRRRHRAGAGADRRAAGLGGRVRPRRPASRSLPLSELGRPRIDVTLRISGFFRDAFPTQIALFHEAVQAVAERDEPEDANPIAARIRVGC